MEIKILHLPLKAQWYEMIESRISITEQEKWRLDKFDITFLKPFSEVLVRNANGYWSILHEI